EATARAKASQILGPSITRANAPVLALDPALAEYRAIPASSLAPGMRLRVGLEQQVPVDAELVGAPAEVNLAVLTGESAPRLLQPGERIPAGAVPVGGPVECVALRSARNSTLERLAELARQLRQQSSVAQRWADRFAAALVPSVWVLALGTLAFW